MKKQFLLMLLSPALLTLGWPPLISGFLLFMGFVPLFLLEMESKKGFWLKIYVALLLWNIGTTWWVWNASPEGCIAMLLANSLLMSFPWLIYRRIRKYFGMGLGLTAWCISWLAMEYLHLNWQIAYPWLNLGNGLATLPQLIQWYEYTGTLGGTLWILILNVLIFQLIRQKFAYRPWALAAAVLVPVLISWFLKGLRSDASPSTQYLATVVQPNIDPYQKFESMDSRAEAAYFMKMAEKVTTSSTEFVLFPETALTEYCEEAYIDQTPSYRMMKEWLTKFPKATLVSGANTYRFLDSNRRSPTARKNNSGNYFDVYNASVVMTGEGVLNIYRKSKLVPGVEKMPYPMVFGFLEKYALDLGGISGSLGSDSVPRVFYSQNRIGAAPLICYESIFGEYVSGFVNRGAAVIFVLTNDGWWGNTPGYRQHKLYARLRAIENRREVVRCTNTGVSCHIDALGNIEGETAWWEPAVASYKITPHHRITFYTRHGDYIGRWAAWLFGIVIIVSIPAKWLSRKIFS